MSRNNKRSSFGWAIGMSLGIACSAGIAHAGSISDTYNTGDTLTATTMTNIKNAVNDNDTRLNAVINNTQAGALKTAVDANTAAITTINTTNATQTNDIANLQGGVPGATCAGNPAVTGDAMVRVGPICVDKYEAKIVTGTAQSVAGDTPTTSVDWITAAQACAKAGKRLLTIAEWQVAAAGTNAANCNTTSAALVPNSASSTCVSTLGAVNMVGNAVEWVADWSGLANTTTALSDNIGVLRGGDATDGVNASENWLQTGVGLSSTDPLRGFRCAR